MVVRSRAFITAALILGVAGGCEAPSKKYTQSQLIELQSRFVKLAPEPTYDAAVQALLDAEYSITASDKRGGVLAASKLDDQNWRSIAVTVTVAPAPGGSTVRVSTLVDGKSRVDEATIREYQDTLQRRVDLFAADPLKRGQ